METTEKAVKVLIVTTVIIGAVGAGLCCCGIKNYDASSIEPFNEFSTGYPDYTGLGFVLALLCLPIFAIFFTEEMRSRRRKDLRNKAKHQKNKLLGSK